ncbi:MAG: hypothetical protein ACP6IS_03395 [Candidatus Asgardarchaeia archaeon]
MAINSVHLINESGVPVLSISMREEPIDPEIMSAIVTTLKALAETSKASGEFESFSIGGTQFYAISLPKNKLTLVVSVEKPSKSDLAKIDEIKNAVNGETDIAKMEEKIREILQKESLLDKTRKWADEVWG